VTTKPLKLCTRAVQAETTPQRAMQTGYSMSVIATFGTEKATYEIDAGSDASQKHIRWNLESNVTGKQNRDCRVELIALETQIFFYALDSCVGQSVAVEVAMNID